MIRRCGIIDCATIEAYRRAHIPGAVHLPVHYYIKEAGEREGGAGMFVMPPDEFAQLMGSLGVDSETTVVTYDDNNALVAARLWWVLNYYSHTKAKVPERRLASLAEQGCAQPRFTQPARKRRPSPRGRWQRCTRVSMTSSLSTTHARARSSMSAARKSGTERTRATTSTWAMFRAPSTWSGRRLVEQTDTRRFLPAEDMQALLSEAGVTPNARAITYCQGGIRAAHTAFALALLGYEDVRVYDGSMYEWANREDTPLVT